MATGLTLWAATAAQPATTLDTGASIAVSPLTGTVVVGKNGSVFRSANGGSSWSSAIAVTTVGGPIVCLDDGTFIFVTSSAVTKRIYRSTDDGLTWTQVSSLGNSGAIIGYHDDWVAVGWSSVNYILYSTDGGATWTQSGSTTGVSATPPGIGVSKSGGYIAMPVSGGYRKFTVSSTSWGSVVAFPATPTMFVTNDGVWRIISSASGVVSYYSSSDGDSWNGPASVTTSLYTAATPGTVLFRVAADDGQTLLVTYQDLSGQAVAVSYDGGVYWDKFIVSNRPKVSENLTNNNNKTQGYDPISRYFYAVDSVDARVEKAWNNAFGWIRVTDSEQLVVEYVEPPETNAVVYDEETLIIESGVAPEANVTITDAESLLIEPLSPDDVPTISITDSEKLTVSGRLFSYWNELPETLPGTQGIEVLTAHVKAYHVATATEVDFYFATEPMVTSPTDTPANTPFDPFLADVPVIETSFELDFSGSNQTWGEVTLFNDGRLDALATDYIFDSRKIELRMGRRGDPYNSFVPFFHGRIADGIQVDTESLILPLRSNAQLLDKKFLEARYPEFLADNVTPHPSAGELIPEAWGGGLDLNNYVFNAVPVLINHQTEEYQIHNGETYAIIEVADKGASVSFTPNLSAGTFVLASPPQGELRVKVCGGKVDSAFVYSAADLALMIAKRAGLGDDDIDLESVAMLKYADGPGKVARMGFQVRGEETCIELLKLVLSSVNGIHEFRSDNGKLVFRKAIGSPSHYELGGSYAPLLTVGDDDIVGDFEVVEIMPPTPTVPIKYRKNWGTITEIAASVLQFTPEYAKKLREEWSELYATSPNPNIGNYPSASALESAETMAVGIVYPTYIAGARAEWRGYPRFTVSFKYLPPVGLALALGDHIAINTDRIGFNTPGGAKRWAIYKVVKQPGDGYTEVYAVEMPGAA